MGRPRRASFLERGIQRLFDRDDVAMARIVAGLLLILEAILCINIIKYVSCESLRKLFDQFNSQIITHRQSQTRKSIG